MEGSNTFWEDYTLRWEEKLWGKMLEEKSETKKSIEKSLCPVLQGIKGHTFNSSVEGNKYIREERIIQDVQAWTLVRNKTFSDGTRRIFVETSGIDWNWSERLRSELFIPLLPPQSLCSSALFFITDVNIKSSWTKCSLSVHLDSTKDQMWRDAQRPGRFCFPGK